MAAVADEGKDNTSPGMDLQQAMFDELRDIGCRMKKLGEHMEKLEKTVSRVVTDLHTVHQLQRTYTSRLAVIEQMCVDTPLKSTPSSGSRNDGDGKLNS